MTNSELLSSVFKRQQIQYLLNKLPSPICLSSIIWVGWAHLPNRYFYSSLTTSIALQMLIGIYLAKSIKRDSPTILSAAQEIDFKLNTKDRLTALISLPSDHQSQQLSTLLTNQLEPFLENVRASEIAPLSVSRSNIVKLFISAFLIIYSVMGQSKPPQNGSQIALINHLLDQHQLPPPLEESLNELVETLSNEDLSSDEVTSALSAAEKALALAESQVLNGINSDETFLQGVSDTEESLNSSFQENKTSQRGGYQPTNTPTATPQPQTSPHNNNPKGEDNPKQQDKDVDVQHSKSSQQKGEQSTSSDKNSSDQKDSDSKESSQQSQGETEQNKQNQQGQQKQKQDGSDGQAQGSKSSSGQESQDKSSQSNSGSKSSEGGKEGQEGGEQGESSGSDGGDNQSGGQGDSQEQQEQSSENQASESGKNDISKNGSNSALSQVKQSLEAIKNAQKQGEDQRQLEGKAQGQNQNNRQKPGRQSGKAGSPSGENKESSNDQTSGQDGSDKKDPRRKEPINRDPESNGSSAKGQDSKESSRAQGKAGQNSSQPDEQSNQQNEEKSEQTASKKSASKQEGSGGMALPSEQSETKDGLPDDGEGPSRPQRPPQFKEKQIGEAQESYDLSATGSEQGRILNRNEAEYKRKLKELNLSKPAERTDSQSQKVPLEYREWLD